MPEATSLSYRSGLPVELPPQEKVATDMQTSPFRTWRGMALADRQADEERQDSVRKEIRDQDLHRLTSILECETGSSNYERHERGEPIELSEGEKHYQKMREAK